MCPSGVAVKRGVYKAVSRQANHVAQRGVDRQKVFLAVGHARLDGAQDKIQVDPFPQNLGNVSSVPGFSSPFQPKWATSTRTPSVRPLEAVDTPAAK